jgi:amino acid transporter
MTVLAGGTVATFAATGVIAVPLSFPLLAVALGLFAIGYTRLARDVPHAATFAALLTHGLGRTVGAAAAFVAVLSYNCVQIGLYGLLGATLAGQLGGPWWGWALAAWTVVAVIGYRGVTLGAPVVAVVLTLELGMIVLFDVVALTHPAQAEAGAWLQPWSPDLLAVDGVGGVLAFGVAAFLGFETTRRSGRRCAPTARSAALRACAWRSSGSSTGSRRGRWPSPSAPTTSSTPPATQARGSPSPSWPPASARSGRWRSPPGSPCWRARCSAR